MGLIYLFTFASLSSWIKAICGLFKIPMNNPFHSQCHEAVSQLVALLYGLPAHTKAEITVFRSEIPNRVIWKDTGWFLYFFLFHLPFYSPYSFTCYCFNFVSLFFSIITKVQFVPQRKYKNVVSNHWLILYYCAAVTFTWPEIHTYKSVSYWPFKKCSNN